MPNRFANDATFAELGPMIESGGPVLADFYATWCGPCQAMAPIVERLAQRFAGRAQVVKVDIDERPDLAVRFGVRGVPSFLLFAGGRAVARTVGTSSEEALAALIERYAHPAQDSTEALSAA
ncbi:MAG: thioredoxin family protein [Acidobacteria bacterium]|nr:thioredoxin family protein [Acidobacteriota bacterium]